MLIAVGCSKEIVRLVRAVMVVSRSFTVGSISSLVKLM